MSKFLELHRNVVARLNTSSLRIQDSKCNTSCSIHTLNETVSIAEVTSCYKSLRKDHGNSLFLGTIDKNITMSVNFKHTTQSMERSNTSGKKRRREAFEEEVTRAVQKVMKSATDEDQIKEEQYDKSKSVILDMLRLRASHGENIIESWALSLRKQGEWASANQSTLVAAFRITAGVAIVIGQLLDCMHGCLDGMLTIDSDRVSKEFNLPMSEQAMSAESNGQRTMLLLVTIESSK